MIDLPLPGWARPKDQTDPEPAVRDGGVAAMLHPDGADGDATPDPEPTLGEVSQPVDQDDSHLYEQPAVRVELPIVLDGPVTLAGPVREDTADQWNARTVAIPAGTVVELSGYQLLRRSILVVNRGDGALAPVSAGAVWMSSQRDIPSIAGGQRSSLLFGEGTTLYGKGAVYCYNPQAATVYVEVTTEAYAGAPSNA